MSIEKNITELLKPFNERRNWVLHYPVYLNTFCLAYHLASTLQNEGLGRESTYRHFLRQDWWGKLNGGLPDFTYKADIEIFFATDDLKEEAKGLGHQIRAFPITNYLNRTIFFLKKNNDNKQKDVCDHENILLITDIPLTAKLFKDSLVNSVENGTEPPDWWRRRFGKSSPKNLRVKHCWEREIFDFFDVVPKIYLFSAPRAWVMAHQDKRYEPENIDDIKPVTTYLAFRINSGVDEGEISMLSGALCDYYKKIFKKYDGDAHTAFIEDFGGINARKPLPELYARMATTIGQPHPFAPYSLGDESMSYPPEPEEIEDMVKNYHKIVIDHHNSTAHL